MFTLGDKLMLIACFRWCHERRLSSKCYKPRCCGPITLCNEARFWPPKLIGGQNYNQMKKLIFALAIIMFSLSILLDIILSLGIIYLLISNDYFKLFTICIIFLINLIVFVFCANYLILKQITKRRLQ